MPFWALLLSWLLAKILREPDGEKAGWRSLAGDVITSFGTIVFAPVSGWRAAIGTTFIIDLWFSGIILAGLTASAVFYRSKWPALAACVVLAGYVGFQYAQRQQALDFGARHAWPGARIDAHPRPVSPFNWTVFVSARPGALGAPHALRRGGAAARERGVGLAGFYRWFAAQPAFDGADARCVWFVDLRAVASADGACSLRPSGAGSSFRRRNVPAAAAAWRTHQARYACDR